MCGRYTLFTGRDDLEARFDATFAESFQPSYNCAPGQDLPVISNADPGRIVSMHWGLTPEWADEPFNLVNARAETAREKRSFAEAYESRRCLVPADSFYEWNETADGKQPYRVAFEDDRPFAMAGLYERWTPPIAQTGLGDFGDGDANGVGATDPADVADDEDDGDGTTTDDVLESFTILTTEPNDLVADLHDRMAVVLDEEDEDTWLHGDATERASLLEPYPETEMNAYPVSKRVNAPSNDDSSLIEPTDA